MFISLETVNCRAKSLCSKLAYDKPAISSAVPRQNVKSNNSITKRIETNAGSLPLFTRVFKDYVLIISWSSVEHCVCVSLTRMTQTIRPMKMEMQHPASIGSLFWRESTVGASYISLAVTNHAMMPQQPPLMVPIVAPRQVQPFQRREKKIGKTAPAAVTLRTSPMKL